MGPSIFNPKVSLVIPVYNGSDYLGEAIESALCQTYPNMEILVVNDGSNDIGETARIARSYGARIRYIEKPNGGVASALNAAVSTMTGEYLSWLSHDDLYYPDKVESQVCMLGELENRESVILYGDYVGFYEDDLSNHTTINLPHTPPESFRYFITTNNILHGCTLLIPKRAFDECGGFNERLRTTQDYDLWFRMAVKFRFVHMPKLLVKTRAHAGQGSIKLRQTALVEINELLTGFVRNLSVAELRTATGESLAVAYARVSENFRGRCFSLAADVAQEMALKNISDRSLWEQMKIVLILMRAKLILVPMEWWRRKMYLLKTKVKQCLS